MPPHVDALVLMQVSDDVRVEPELAAQARVVEEAEARRQGLLAEAGIEPLLEELELVVDGRSSQADARRHLREEPLNAR